jgi:chromosome segregation ATPase
MDDNYKQKNEELRRQLNIAQDKQKAAEEKLQKCEISKQNLEDKLKNEISSLQAKLNETKTELKNTERERSELLQRVNSWASITKDFSETTDKQQKLFENTFEELNNVKADKVKLEKELEDTTSKLMEKMAIIDTLETKVKRLTEQKTDLQDKIDNLLKKPSQTTTEPVTYQQGPQPRQSSQQTKELTGVVKKVETSESMVEISIGSADGVQEGMKFYVIRGDEFVCEVLILDVEPESAVGAMERVQYQPRSGDKVTSNL